MTKLSNRTITNGRRCYFGCRIARAKKLLKTQGRDILSCAVDFTKNIQDTAIASIKKMVKQVFIPWLDFPELKDAISTAWKISIIFFYEETK